MILARARPCSRCVPCSREMFFPIYTCNFPSQERKRHQSSGARWWRTVRVFLLAVSRVRRRANAPREARRRRWPGRHLRRRAVSPGHQSSVRPLASRRSRWRNCRPSNFRRVVDVECVCVWGCFWSGTASWSMCPTVTTWACTSLTAAEMVVVSTPIPCAALLGVGLL